MDRNERRGSSPSSSSSSPSSPLSSILPSVANLPCAACKILRRKCSENCMLAPYFPQTDPLKFATAHRIFGASNIIKLLRDLPESKREDAVMSMVYEAKTRIRDPVYGSAGAICQLQKQVLELQTKLAQAKAEIIMLQCQQESLHACLSSSFQQAQHSFHMESPVNIQEDILLHELL